jgi:diguanylate cyclase (GGDEF)-like protein
MNLSKSAQGVMIVKLLGIAILLYGLLIGISSIFIEKRMQELKKDELRHIAKKFEKEINASVLAKKESLSYLALALSNDKELINALLQDKSSSLDFHSFLRYLRENTSMRNVSFRVTNKEGKDFYSSKTYKDDDSLFNEKIDVLSIMYDRKLKTIMSIGKNGIILKVFAPIFSNRRTLGLFEIITRFDSIAEDVVLMGKKPVVLVDKSYAAKLSVLGVNNFIQQYFLLSRGSDIENINFLKSQNIEHILSSNLNFYQNKELNKLILFNTLHDDNGIKIGHILYFMDLSSIDFSRIYQSKRDFFILISISYAFVMMIVLFVFMKRNSRSMEQFNSVLQYRVEEKTDELNKQKVFLQEVIDGVSDSVMVINDDYSISMMNEVARNSIEKDSIKDVNNPKCYEVLHKRVSPCSGEDYPCPLSDVIKYKKNITTLHNHTDKNKKLTYYELSATPLLDEDGDVEAVIEVGHDITMYITTQVELREQKDNLRHLAHHDTLTGLPNRLLFLDRLSHALKLAKRLEQSIAILFLDLDHFKQINDSLGHSAGDFLLETIAKRLKSSVREVDTVARLGGDEFTIILEGYEHGIVGIVHKLIEEVSKVVEYKDHKLYTSVSIGISMYPKDGDSCESLLRNADAAMYKAKEVGRNRHQFYTADMTDKAMEWVIMESSIRKALKEDEFILEYQPQYDSRDNSLVGMEALVRWEHPTLGMLYPGNFISLAEDSSLIIALGERVLELAAHQTALWHAQGYKFGRVAVNISVKQLQEVDFIFKIASILKKAACSPSWIEIEVTESSVMYDTDTALARLREIQKMGIVLAMDDFGTGYSSLSLLKRLPIHKLKIDYSFIKDIPDDEESAAIAITVIELAKNMNLNVLAEGVENEQQKSFLQKHSCYYIQGFLYSKPLNADTMTKLLEQTLL